MCLFFFKQKTAYEMRISDWSSDVCSSDLKSLGEINPPVVKFAGNAQPLGSLRVVAFKRLQEISGALGCVGALIDGGIVGPLARFGRSDEHTSELQLLMRISYAVVCLEKKMGDKVYGVWEAPLVEHDASVGNSLAFRAARDLPDVRHDD